MIASELLDCAAHLFFFKSKNQTMRSKTRFVLRHRSGEGHQNILAALKVPKNTVASIKTFGPSKTVPRAGHPAKLSSQGRRSIVRAVTKNPRKSLLQSSSIPLWRWENLAEGQPSLLHSNYQAFMVDWPDGSHSSVKGT